METDKNHKTPNNKQIGQIHLKVADIQRFVDFYFCLFTSGHPEILFRENDKRKKSVLKC